MVLPMEPISTATAATLYYSVKGLLDLGAAGLNAADDKVAKEAEAQGISKDAAWVAIRGEVKRRNAERVERIFDPLGWKAAARELAKSDEWRAEDGAPRA